MQKVDEYKKKFGHIHLKFPDKYRDYSYMFGVSWIMVRVPIEQLKKQKTVESRVAKIIKLTSKASTRYAHNGRTQCRPDASRSAGDIWRIYLHYFKPVTLERIMKALRKLAEDGEIGSMYCGDVRKRVFYPGSMFHSSDVTDEFGLKFPDWENL